MLFFCTSQSAFAASSTHVRPSSALVGPWLTWGCHVNTPLLPISAFLSTNHDLACDGPF